MIIHYVTHTCIYKYISIEMHTRTAHHISNIYSCHGDTAITPNNAKTLNTIVI